MAASTFAAAGCVETAVLPRRIRLMMIHMAWRCWCGKSIYAPQPGPHCRLRDKGPVSMWEDDQRRTPDDDR
jgi:hypothetical protein